MPYGDEYYSMNDIQDAINNYYDRMPGRPYHDVVNDPKYKTTVAPDKDTFTKSSKFDRMNEAKIKSEEEFADQCFNSKRHVQKNMWEYAKKTLLKTNNVQLDPILEKILNMEKLDRELFLREIN